MISFSVRFRTSWIGLFIIVSPIVICTFLALVYHNRSVTGQPEWSYYIDEYYSPEDIEKQILLLKSVSFDTSQISDNSVSQINDSIIILEYLKDNSLSYDDVSDGRVIYSNLRNQRSFISSIFESLAFINIAVLVIAIAFINNEAKSNGAYVLYYLSRGRGKCFKSEAFTFFFVILYVLFSEILFVLLILTAYPKTHDILIFCRDSHVFTMSATAEAIWSALALTMFTITIGIIEFILSELINPLRLFLPIGLLLGYSIPTITSIFKEKSRIIKCLTIGRQSLYVEGESSPVFFWIVKSVLFLFLSAIIVIAYRFVLRKPIKTEYD